MTVIRAHATLGFTATITPVGNVLGNGVVTEAITWALSASASTIRPLIIISGGGTLAAAATKKAAAAIQLIGGGGGALLAVGAPVITNPGIRILSTGGDVALAATESSIRILSSVAGVDLAIGESSIDIGTLEVTVVLPA